jgi:hypothetical protein
MIKGRSNGRTMEEVKVVATTRITTKKTRMKEVAMDGVHHRNREAMINTSSNSGRTKDNIRSKEATRSRTTTIATAMLHNLSGISTARDLNQIDNINMTNAIATMHMVDLRHLITTIRMGRGDQEINGRNLARLRRDHDVSAETPRTVFVLTRSSETENTHGAIIAKELSMG